MTIAIQGDKGSNHYLISQRLLKDKDSNFYCAKPFRDVFEAVKNGKADIGIIAIENSIAGSILQNFDLISEYGFPVIGEGYLRISHSLIGLRGAQLSDIKVAYSHEMALKQCDVFLREHSIEAREYYDTAASVPFVKELADKSVAGIAPRVAAEIYGLEVIKEGIETNKQNYTRFIVFTQNSALVSLLNQKQNSHSKTMIEFETDHKPGSLAAVLTLLASYGVNLTKIESRPIVGEVWVYRFFVDFTFDGTDAAHTEILQVVKDEVANFKLLGRFPEGEVFQ